MKQLADGVWQFAGFPPNAFNVYLAEDVLIDAGARSSRRRIFRQLKGHRLSAHALTHAHSDHQGASHAVCEAFQVPLWCGEADVEAMEDGDIAARQPDHWLNRVNQRLMAGPPHPVDRPLREGDEVAGFRILDVPGHSPGHLAYWRESDRTLILGDVLNNMNLRTGLPGLHEPPKAFTPDPPRNRASARRLAPLEPRLVLFGHGPPLRDTGKLVDFISGLPEDSAAGAV